MPEQPDLAELITLQRRSLSIIDRITRAIDAPRRTEIKRDERGKIIGAVSSIDNNPNEGSKT